MRVYADYAFYTGRYLGSQLSGELFPALALRASAYLDRLTFERAEYAEGGDAERVQMACCAVAEAFAALDRGELSSETVGDWSRAYRGEQRTRAGRVYDAALLYLAGSPLLFRGWRSV